MTRGSSVLLWSVASLTVACADQPEQAPEPPAAAPREQVVGHWQSESRGDELHLHADGTAEGRQAGSELTGRYEWRSDGEIEIELSGPGGLEVQTVRSVEVRDDRLELTSERGHTTVYRRQ